MLKLCCYVVTDKLLKATFNELIYKDSSHLIFILDGRVVVEAHRAPDGSGRAERDTRGDT